MRGHAWTFVAELHGRALLDKALVQPVHKVRRAIRHDYILKFIFTVNLVKHPAIAEMGVHRLAPAAKHLLDGEGLDRRELRRIFFRISGLRGRK